MNNVNLHFREYGDERPARPAIVLLHGFLGSGTNWHSIARKLSDRHRVLVPDLRNHGQSPHAREMDYAAMADDLEALLHDEGLDRVVLVGHSMGGKLAMEYALRHPDQVERLAVVDIAPVRYRHGFDAVFAALRSVRLDEIDNRREADRMMQAHLEMEALRQFLLQNLEKGEDGWRWRIDLDILEAAVPAIQDIPPSLEGHTYDGPTLFIHGAQSDYVSAASRPTIGKHFPAADYLPISGAGHWVYAEQPETFLSSLHAFLEP